MAFPIEYSGHMKNETSRKDKGFELNPYENFTFSKYVYLGLVDTFKRKKVQFKLLSNNFVLNFRH